MVILLKNGMPFGLFNVSRPLNLNVLRNLHLLSFQMVYLNLEICGEVKEKNIIYSGLLAL